MEEELQITQNTYPPQNQDHWPSSQLLHLLETGVCCLLILNLLDLPVGGIILEQYRVDDQDDSIAT